MTAEYLKPLPKIDSSTRPFWDACNEDRLILPFCRACESVFFYPRVLCPSCLSDDLDWVESSGRGVVYSFTVVRRTFDPAFSDDLPYVAALIDLEEGARLMSSIEGCDPDAVRCGDHVEVSFDHVTPEVTLPRFRLAAPAGAPTSTSLPNSTH